MTNATPQARSGLCPNSSGDSVTLGSGCRTFPLAVSFPFGAFHGRRGDSGLGSIRQGDLAGILRRLSSPIPTGITAHIHSLNLVL